MQVSQEGGSDLKVEAAEQAADGGKKRKPGPKKKRAPVSGQKKRQQYPDLESGTP